MSENIAETPLAPSDIIPCPVCLEPVKRGARKCIHCDSYLDWRRHITLGANTIPVLATLITLIAAASTLIAPLFKVYNSKLNTIFGGVGSSMLNGEVTITVTNDGTRVGVFDAAMLGVTWKSNTRDLSFDIPLGNGSTVPIYPGASTTIQLAIGLSARFNDPTTPADAQALLTSKIANDYSTAPIAHAVCILRTDSTDGNGKTQIQVQPVTCLPFAPWLIDSVRRPQ
jgi:hypothetical protein